MATSNGPWMLVINFMEVFLVAKGKHENVLAELFDLHRECRLPSFLNYFFDCVVTDIFGGV